MRAPPALHFNITASVLRVSWCADFEFRATHSTSTPLSQRREERLIDSDVLRILRENRGSFSRVSGGAGRIGSSWGGGSSRGGGGGGGGTLDPIRWPVGSQGEPRLTAAIPMENPYCSCNLLLAVSHGLQLRSLCRIPTAAVG